MKDQLKASDIDYKTQITTLRFIFESYKDEVTPQLVALNEQMKADYEILSAADVLLAQQLEEAQASLQAAIGQNSEDITANAEAIQAAIAEYKKLVGEAVQDFESALAKAREDQASVDGAQDAALATLASQIATYKEAIDESVAALSGSVEELAAMMEETQGSIEDLASAMKKLEGKVDANLAAALAYTDALEASVNATILALSERIEANEVAIRKLNEETIPEIEEAIMALQESMVGLEGNLEALEEKKLDQDVFQAFLTIFGKWQDKVDTDIAGINGTLEQLQQFETVLDNEIKEISALVDVLNGDETVSGSVKQQIKALHEGIIEHLNELKGEIEGEIQDLEDELAGIQEDIEAVNADIVVIHGQIADANAAVAEIDGKIDAEEGDLESLHSAKTALEGKISALEELLSEKESAIKALLPAIEEKIALINGDKDTPGSIAYAVDQLDQSIKVEIGKISGRIDKTDAEIAELQKEIGKLQQGIQSLVFVPQYQDLKFGLPFVKIDGVYKDYNVGPGFAVVYKVAPAHLAKPLAKAVNDAIAAGIELPFKFDIVSDLQTRAADTDPLLLIKDAVGDEGNGKMTFFLSHKNFDPAGDNLDKYAISLRADNDDYNVHVASGYVQAVLSTVKEITILTDYVYKPDPATGTVEEDTKIATTGEHNYDIPYTDRKVHAFLQGYEMAARDEMGVIRTFSQWKALKYDMPEVTEEAGRFYGDAKEYINDTFKGSSSTFAMKNLNMIEVKKKIGLYNKYNISFTCGSHVANVRMRVTIGKYQGAFHFKFRYKMTWDYELDAEVDHYNKDKTPDKWKGYTRKGAVYWPYSRLVMKAYLIVDGEERELSGANRVYGLHPYDFTWGRFDPQPAGSNFDVISTYDERTLSLTEFNTTPGERLGEEYVYTGSYNCFDKYSTEPDVTTIVITTVDRKTEDILLPAPSREVKLLGAEFNKSDDYYSISSDNFAEDLMKAYIGQGIFNEDYSREKAFTGEFASMKEIEHTGLSTNFEIVNKAGGSESGDENFQIRSKGEKLKSSVLHEVAGNYENKPWSMTYETYVGQRITLTWPLSAAPLHDYRFVTNGQDTFQVPIGWQGGPDAITKARTELDLLNFGNYVQIKYNEGGSEHEVSPAQYKDHPFRLIPKFSLVNAAPGVDVVDSPSVTGLDCISHVTYYSQVPSVGVKSSLYIRSGSTDFLVPGGDQLYVGGNPVSSVTVTQSNPIAAQQTIPVPPATIEAGKGLVELTMKDVLEHYIYISGRAQNGQYPFASSATIAGIFQYVRFSVYSVNGSTAFRGWSMEGGDSFGVSDTPDYVRLITSGVAAGSYTVVLKAKTAWKDYYYTVKVNVQ
ncbi:MAG: hypothetical protein E7109_05080 [Bacteroidales bacterium]|nr:hypothetical protein [Bacteroidales bacterium]